MAVFSSEEETGEETVSPFRPVAAPGFTRIGRLNRHRHRFRQPSLFVSSGNAKGKGALPLLAAASSPSPRPSLLPHPRSLFLFRGGTHGTCVRSTFFPALEIRRSPSPILLILRCEYFFLIFGKCEKREKIRFDSMDVKGNVYIY